MRVNKSQEKHEKQADGKINKIRKAHIMALRQMKTERAKFDRRIHAQPRDILADYTQYESEVSFMGFWRFFSKIRSKKTFFELDEN